MRRMYSEQELTKLIQKVGAQVIESGEVENAKPLYWHGITIYQTTLKNSFQFHILNNSSTKFTKLSDIKAWAEAISGQVIISGNGVIKIENNWYPMISITKSGSNQYSILYTDSANGGTTLSNVTLEDNFSQNLADDMNKLN